MYQIVMLNPFDSHQILWYNIQLPTWKFKAFGLPHGTDPRMSGSGSGPAVPSRTLSVIREACVLPPEQRTTEQIDAWLVLSNGKTTNACLGWIFGDYTNYITQLHIWGLYNKSLWRVPTKQPAFGGVNKNQTEFSCLQGLAMLKSFREKRTVNNPRDIGRPLVNGYVNTIIYGIHVTITKSTLYLYLPVQNQPCTYTFAIKQSTIHLGEYIESASHSHGFH